MQASPTTHKHFSFFQSASTNKISSRNLANLFPELTHWNSYYINQWSLHLNFVKEPYLWSEDSEEKLSIQAGLPVMGMAHNLLQSGSGYIHRRSQSMAISGQQGEAIFLYLCTIRILSESESEWLRRSAQITGVIRRGGFALIIKILQFWMSWQMQSGRCCCPGGSTPQQFYRRRSFEVVQFCMGELRSIWDETVRRTSHRSPVQGKGPGDEPHIVHLDWTEGLETNLTSFICTGQRAWGRTSHRSPVLYRGSGDEPHIVHLYRAKGLETNLISFICTLQRVWRRTSHRSPVQGKGSGDEPHIVHL